MTTPQEVLRRRHAQRERLIQRARAFTDALPAGLGVRAVAVFGSVARGDFDDDSDVDVLVVAEGLPDDFRQRLRSLGPPQAHLDAVAWTPDEWRTQHAKGNPIAAEAVACGVWLRGAPEGLEHPAPAS